MSKYTDYHVYYGARMTNNLRGVAENIFSMVDYILLASQAGYHLVSKSPLFIFILPITRTLTLTAFFVSLLRRAYKEEGGFGPDTRFYAGCIGILFVLFAASTAASLFLSGVVGIALMMSYILADAILEVMGLWKRYKFVKEKRNENLELEKTIASFEAKALLRQLSDVEHAQLKQLKKMHANNEALIHNEKRIIRSQYLYLINSSITLAGASLLIPVSLLVGPAVAASLALPPVALALLITASAIFLLTAIFSPLYSTFRKKADLKKMRLLDSRDSLLLEKDNLDKIASHVLDNPDRVETLGVTNERVRLLPREALDKISSGDIRLKLVSDSVVQHELEQSLDSAKSPPTPVEKVTEALGQTHHNSTGIAVAPRAKPGVHSKRGDYRHFFSCGTENRLPGMSANAYSHLQGRTLDAH